MGWPNAAATPEPARPLPVIVNASAGRGASDLHAELRAAFEAAGVRARFITVQEGDDVPLLARRAVRERHPVIVAAGGDGTVNAVAAEVCGSSSALGVIPMGTLNHFARDLGVPEDLAGAVRTLAANYQERVDVATVNGRVFVNNSSIGLYPSLVIHREYQQRRMGRGKWHAALWASLTVLRRHPMLDVTLYLEDRVKHMRTPLVFIGNNEYVVEGLEIGRRERLHAGTLAIYVTRRHGRRGLVALALRSLFGSLRRAMDLEEIKARRVTIATQRKLVAVATDGEVSMMSSPLEYEIRPGALRVVVPPPGERP